MSYSCSCGVAWRWLNLGVAAWLRASPRFDILVWYCTVRYGVIWCRMIWYGMLWFLRYGMVWYGIRHCCIIDLIWYSMVRYTALNEYGGVIRYCVAVHKYVAAKRKVYSLVGVGHPPPPQISSRGPLAIVTDYLAKASTPMPTCVVYTRSFFPLFISLFRSASASHAGAAAAAAAASRW